MDSASLQITISATEAFVTTVFNQFSTISPSSENLSNSQTKSLSRSQDLFSASQLSTVMKCLQPFRFLICILGIISNAFCVRTFIRMGLEDSVTIVFLSLAISDLFLLVTTFATIPPLVCLSLEQELGIVFPVQSFDVAFTLTLISRPFGTITKLLTTFLALQRCLCVVIPLHFKGLFTRFRTYIVLLIIWSYPLGTRIVNLSAFRFVKVENSSSTVLVQSPWVRKVNAYVIVAHGIVFNFSSQAIVLLCLMFLVCVLNRSVRFRQRASSFHLGAIGKSKNQNRAKETEQGSKSPPSYSKENRVILQVSLVSAIFLITNAPYTAIFIATRIVPEFYVYKQHHNFYSSLFTVGSSIELINSAVNLLVYHKYNTKFRLHCFRKRFEEQR